MSNSLISNNVGTKDPIFLGISLDSARESLFSSTEFSDNTSEVGGLSFLYANVKFDTCTFRDNEASLKAPNISATLSTLTIENSSFSDTFQSDSAGYGRFMFLDSESTATISGSTFENGATEYGGSIYLSGCKFNLVKYRFNI